MVFWERFMRQVYFAFVYVSDLIDEIKNLRT